MSQESKQNQSSSEIVRDLADNEEIGEISVYLGRKFAETAVVADAKKIMKMRSLAPIMLSNFSSHPWNALGLACGQEVEKEISAAAANKCPILKQKYSAIVPVFILANDLKKYADRVTSENRRLYIIDRDWSWIVVRDMIEGNHAEERIGSVRRALLGSGFQTGILPSDGEASIKWIAVPLENGDVLIAAGWVWYNK